MIKSDIIKLNKIDGFDNLYVEKELAKRYKSVIRWAIVDVDKDLTVSVSYENSSSANSA